MCCSARHLHKERHRISVQHDSQITLYAHKIVKSARMTRGTPAVNPIALVPEEPGLGAASFNDSALGQWIVPKSRACPHPVTPQSIPVLEGVVRSAFGLALNQFSLEPIATNPLNIFTCKQIDIQPRSYFSLT